MASSNVDRFVTLKDGPTLPIEPVMLALELEERGFQMTREGDDTLSVQPYQRLTREDCARISRWKPHILALLAYEPPSVQ